MKRTLAVLLVVSSVAALCLWGCGKQKPAGSAGTGALSAHGEATPSAGTSPAGPPPGADTVPGAGAAAPGMGGMGGAPAMGGAPEGSTPTSAAGLAWRKPGAWGLDPPHTMRVATYRIPAAAGDAAGATCAVYWFGPGQGGGVDANLERWIGQFQPAKSSNRTTREVNGVRVSLADAAGTYTAHGGSMMQPQGDQPNWRLLGAIAEGPEGSVFFKLTGPEKTVAAARGSFDGMVGSIRRR